MANNPTISEKDNSYWNSFYSNKNVPENPSTFAKLVLGSLEKSKTLVEFGCGNGRDSFFFARNGINITALDLSKEAIAHNSSFNHDNVTFKVADFTKLPKGSFENIGGVYSRFTLHSIDNDSYIRTLDWCAANLDTGGQFYIEARTTNDPLFGEGEKGDHNSYTTDHFRRFFIVKEVIAQLEERGFKATYAIEDYLDSWYKDDHAVVFRIICHKV